MTRTWKMYGLSSLVAAALVTAPAPAPASTEGPGPEVDKFKKLEKSISDMEERVIKAFEMIAKDLKTKADAADTQLKFQTALGKVNDLDKAMKDMRAELEELRKRLPERAPSAYPPSEKPELDEIRTKPARLNKLWPASSRRASPCRRPRPAVSSWSTPTPRTSSSSSTAVPTGWPRAAP